MSARETVAELSIVLMLLCLIVWCFMASYALAQHVTKPNYRYEPVIEVGEIDETQI